MTTATRTELTPVLNHNGQQRFADAGATRQGDPKPMKSCSACGGIVVFVQSAKTGKWYLADCFRYSGNSEAYFYVKASPHFKSCEQRTADRTEDRRIQDERDANSAALKDLKVWMDEKIANGVQLTTDEITAKADELLAAHLAQIAR